MTAATSDAVVLASSMEALLRALPRPLLSPALESALAAAGAAPARAQQALAAIVKAPPPPLVLSGHAASLTPY
jgi:hypothetical protein